MIIDSHAHLYLSDENLDSLIKKAISANIKHIINIGINLETSKKALEQAKKYPDIISATIGIHPGETQDITKLDDIQKIAKKNSFVAMGEMGLDYVKMYAPKQKQWECFEAQLHLASELNMPIIIHNRHADDDILAITRNFPTIPKILHCYSSSLQFAETMLNDKTFFSFSGQLTYSKKGKTLTALKNLPLNHIMIETDTPYLTPKTYQGQRNEPSFITSTLDHIIEHRNEDKEEITTTIFNTTKNFFKIK
jgi:TatD DNase family protein